MAAAPAAEPSPGQVQYRTMAVSRGRSSQFVAGSCFGMETAPRIRRASKLSVPQTSTISALVPASSLSFNSATEIRGTVCVVTTHLQSGGGGGTLRLSPQRKLLAYGLLRTGNPSAVDFQLRVDPIRSGSAVPTHGRWGHGNRRRARPGGC